MCGLHTFTTEGAFRVRVTAGPVPAFQRLSDSRQERLWSVVYAAGQQYHHFLWQLLCNQNRTVCNPAVLSASGVVLELIRILPRSSRWRIGVWGESNTVAGSTMCPYNISLQFNKSSTDHTLELGVPLTVSSLPPFSGRFMIPLMSTRCLLALFACWRISKLTSHCCWVVVLADVPPELVVEIMADQSLCSSTPAPYVKYGQHPTPTSYDFNQFVKQDNKLILALNDSSVNLVLCALPHSSAALSHMRSRLPPALFQKQGPYYLGVFGNDSPCTYTVLAYTTSTPTAPSSY